MKKGIHIIEALTGHSRLADEKDRANEAMRRDSERFFIDFREAMRRDSERFFIDFRVVQPVDDNSTVGT